MTLPHAVLEILCSQGSIGLQWESRKKTSQKGHNSEMKSPTEKKTSSPYGNHRSPESNVPMSNVVFSKVSDQNQPRKGGDIIFPVISQWGGGFLLPWKPEFWSNLPQNHMQPFPQPFWLQRYSSSKVLKFRHSRARTSKMSSLIRPKIGLDRAFMPVLVTSNIDDESIENERASVESPFSHYKSMGFF